MDKNANKIDMKDDVYHPKLAFLSNGVAVKYVDGQWFDLEGKTYNLYFD